MTDEPSTFREQLLDAQPMNPALRDEFRKELQRITHHTLTPRTRVITWALLLAAVAFAVICARAFVIHFAKADSRIILPVYTAVCLATAAFLFHERLGFSAGVPAGAAGASGALLSAAQEAIEKVELWKTLNGDPTVDEVIRNYPVRQPLLWVRSP